ncbi:MAG: metabolite transporter, superfamily protein [Cryptosporangiaceae bacterium]|jgi:metabolite-proton symporter|nr:metabolite transporter, superfamily protein [Cryptosporangiaceae bacterium]
MPRTHRTAAVRTSPMKVASASFIGTTVEYYDFFIYGTAAALVFPSLFFPDSSPLVGTLLSFATLGVGFLARPIGGIVFGHYGDRVGRKTMLVISLLIMGTATVFMGLMPTYEQIGLAAPILLTVLRLVQGFAVGGEWGGATLMAVEHAPAGKRGFYGAFPQMGAPAGVGLATIAFYLAAKLEPGQFASWGWRVPFLLSAILVIVGLLIRLSIAESPEFEKVRESNDRVKLPIAEAFRRHPREIFLVAGTYLSQGVLAYICMSYLVSYATKEVGIARPQVLLGVFVAAVVAVVLYAVFGSLGDRWGRKTTYFIGAVAMLLTVAPAFALINTGSAVNFTIALVLLFGIAMAPGGGVTGSLFSLVFTPEVRYSGASVGYTISQICGAAFAPLIATALYAANGSSTPVVVYLLVVCAISVVSVVLLPGKLWQADPVERDAEVAGADRLDDVPSRV